MTGLELLPSRPSTLCYPIIITVSCQQPDNKTAFYHIVLHYACLANNHSGETLNGGKHLTMNTVNKHKDAFLDNPSALLQGHAHCVWPTLPAPVRIRNRQDIRHTLPCPPLCAHRLQGLHGRMTASLIMLLQRTASQSYCYRKQAAGHFDLSDHNCFPLFWLLALAVKFNLYVLLIRVCSRPSKAAVHSTVRKNVKSSHCKYYNSRSVGLMWHFTVKAFIRNHGGFFFLNFVLKYSINPHQSCICAITMCLFPHTHMLIIPRCISIASSTYGAPLPPCGKQ